MDAASSERYIKELLKTVSSEELGNRLRTFRQNSGLSIRDLADRAMLSKTSIVTLEQGRGCRPVTLEKVCRALNLHVERLAGREGDSPVQKAEDIAYFELDGLSAGPLAQDKVAGSGPLNSLTMFRNVPSDAGFIAGSIVVAHPTAARAHPGAEFGYVIEGSVLININGIEHELGQGESYYVPDNVEHSYRNIGAAAKILVFRLT